MALKDYSLSAGLPVAVGAAFAAAAQVNGLDSRAVLGAFSSATMIGVSVGAVFVAKRTGDFNGAQVAGFATAFGAISLPALGLSF